MDLIVSIVQGVVAVIAVASIVCSLRQRLKMT